MAVLQWRGTWEVSLQNVYELRQNLLLEVSCEVYHHQHTAAGTFECLINIHNTQT
jgi:hypothetical protein